MTFSRQFSPWYLVTAAIAVLGAVFIKFAGINENFLVGFLVVQGADTITAIGQVGYKVVMEKRLELPQHTVFWLFLSRRSVCGFSCFHVAGATQRNCLRHTSMGILLYLGLIASGLGYFMWNKGACMVNAGTLAVMNNVLVPAGLVSEYPYLE